MERESRRSNFKEQRMKSAVYYIYQVYYDERHTCEKPAKYMFDFFLSLINNILKKEIKKKVRRRSFFPKVSP